MDDTISRQAAIDAPEIFIKDCNPEHFVGHQKFIEYMDNAEIGSFGNWQFANGFNMGLTAAEVAIKKLPCAQLEMYGYNIDHLMLIARVLEEKNIPPEDVADVVKDMRLVWNFVLEEFESSLKKSLLEQIPLTEPPKEK